MNIDLVGFQQLLYQIFHHEKKYPVDAICRMMGIGQRRFYSYTEGATYCPVDLVPRIYNATVLYDRNNNRIPAGELRLFNFLTEDTGLEVVFIDRAHDSDSLLKDLADTIEGVGELASTVKKAEEDGRITPQEAESIRDVVSKIQRELENIKAKSAKRATE